MKKTGKILIKKSTFIFLKELSKHNNRDWFAKHKDLYLAEQENMLAFAENLLGKMCVHDEIENASAKKVLFRIYKDVRFSKDKSPYKTSWSGHFRRATKKKGVDIIFTSNPVILIWPEDFSVPMRMT